MDMIVKVPQSHLSLKWKKIFFRGNDLGLSKGQIWGCESVTELQALVDVAYKEIVNRHHPDRLLTSDSKHVPWEKGMPRPVQYEYELGVWLSIPEASRQFGIHPATLVRRLKRGHTLYESVHKTPGKVMFRTQQSPSLLRKAHIARRFFNQLVVLPARSTEVTGFVVSDSLPLGMERW